MQDVEDIVVAWLNGLPDNENYPASGDIPNPRPDSFITVDRTGGPREYLVLDTAEILIEVYHKTSRTAAKNRAKYITDNITQLLNTENITRAKVNSTINLPDLVGKYQRYEVYCDIWHRV